MQVDMGFSIIGIIVLLGGAVAILGGLVLIIVLLANEKTRVVGVVLLALFLLGLGGAGAAVAMVFFGWGSPPQPVRMMRPSSDIAPHRVVRELPSTIYVPQACIPQSRSYRSS